jgi:perosamine synthetase
MTTRELVEVPPLRVCFPEEDVQRILVEVAHILRTGRLSGGAQAAAFEAEFAAAIGVPHAVAMSSGTAALEATFRGIGLRDAEVVLPANTFIATAAAVLHSGNAVRLADVDPLTAAPGLEMLARARTPRTRAVMIVHVGGLMTPELPAIREWCAAEGLLLLEDAAHAHGSRLGMEPAGGFGEAAGFSTFATKVMTTGEGGLLTTRDGDVAARVRVLRDHGKGSTERNHHEVVGNNWRMSEIHAVLGRFQLARLPEFLAARANVAARYDRALAGLPGLTVLRPAGACSWYKYVLLLPAGLDKSELRARMRARGVRLSGDVYDIPLHRQPVFRGALGGPYPGAEEFAARHVCLPIFADITDAEVDAVTSALTTTLQELRR